MNDRSTTIVTADSITLPNTRRDPVPSHLHTTLLYLRPKFIDFEYKPDALRENVEQLGQTAAVHNQHPRVDMHVLDGAVAPRHLQSRIIASYDMCEDIDAPWPSCRIACRYTDPACWTSMQREPTPGNDITQ